MSLGLYPIFCSKITEQIIVYKLLPYKIILLNQDPCYFIKKALHTPKSFLLQKTRDASTSQKAKKPSVERKEKKEENIKITI